MLALRGETALCRLLLQLSAPVGGLDRCIEFTTAAGDIVKLAMQGSGIHRCQSTDLRASIALEALSGGIDQIAEQAVLEIQDIALCQGLRQESPVGECCLHIRPINPHDQQPKLTEKLAHFSEQKVRIL